MESDYHYCFLNISNDEDIEGLQKVCEIYPERNKLLWRNNYANLWMKSVAGNIANMLEDKSLDQDLITEMLMMYTFLDF